MILIDMFMFFVLLSIQDPVSGEVDPELEREARERYQQELVVNQRKWVNSQENSGATFDTFLQLKKLIGSFRTFLIVMRRIPK